MASLPTEAPAAPAPEQEAIIAALIVKHRPEIDRISILNPPDREREMLRYDLDPKTLMEFHKEFVARSKTLEERDKAASDRTATLSWSTFGAALVTTSALRKKISANPLVQGFAIVTSSVASGLAGFFTGTKLFARGVRRESKVLTQEARAIFERELAIAIENKLNSQSPAAETAVSPAMDGRGMAPPIKPRDVSYAAEASAAKAAVGERTH